MQLKKLLELSEKTYALLGWNGAGPVELHPYSVEEGDCFYSCDIHSTKFEGDKASAFSLIVKQVKSLWGRYAKNVEVLQMSESSDENSEFYVWIELRETFKEG